MVTLNAWAGLGWAGLGWSTLVAVTAAVGRRRR